MQNQLYVFLVFILNGLIIGILFDLFRILRKTFKTPNLITYMEDILFWIISGLILLYSIFKFNNGELRAFVFMGIFFGIAIYILFFSKMFISVSVYIINIIKKIFNMLLIIPITYIIKMFKKLIFIPITFLCKKTINFFKIKTKKMELIGRNYKKKKDFG